MAGASISNSLSSSSSRLIAPLKFNASKLFRPKFSSTSAFSGCGGGFGFSICAANQSPVAPVVYEGPSCILVGPIETASQETLEALYRQAKDAYYSGKPLIMDDMFDRVELKLRWYGSKYAVKYPRCSLRRHYTYADAQI